MDSIQNVLVAGAGLAGLSSAISLSKLGKKVTVVERSERLAYGASITIVNRGPDALAELGVLERCIEEGSVGWNTSLYDRIYTHDGHRLPPPGMPIREEDGLPSYVLIYRPILAQILVDRAEELGATIRYGLEVNDLTDHGDRVSATFSDGTVADFDLAIAADGTRSKFREQLFPGRITSTYSGNMSMRWVKKDTPRGPDGFYVTPHSEVVVIHQVGKDLVYIATGLNMEDRIVDQAEAVQLFRQVLGKFPTQYAQDLLATVTEDDEIVVRPYTYHNMPAPWHVGRIVLVGDAVHTMSAHIASGGVMGLEDGIVLAQELAAADIGLDEALLRFARRRTRRTYVAVDACRQMLDLQVNYKAEPAQLHRVRKHAFEELLKPY